MTRSHDESASRRPDDEPKPSADPKPSPEQEADPKAASDAQPADASSEPTADIASALAAAADGLLYLSEGEAPFEPVFKPAMGSGELSPQATLAALGVATVGPIEVRTLDRFFAGHLEQSDPADETLQSLRPRFQKLKDLLLTLTNARAICIGEVEKRCYLVGRTPTGDLAGLVTTTTET